MNERPNWPGSKWWKFDLHAHTPASHDFRGDDADFENWLTIACDAGMNAIAITDHNTADGIAQAQDAAARVENAPVIFPGAELTAADGTHLILIADPDSGREQVDHLLSIADIPVSERGKQESRSPMSVEQILDRCGDDAVIIAAHVNAPKGVLVQLEKLQLQAVLNHPNLAAAEINPDRDLGDLSWIDGSKSEIGRRIPRIYSSDSHCPEEIGKRFTWMKMTEPNLEGLRLALMDGDSSLKPARAGEPGNPNAPASMSIEKIVVRNAKYIGRGGETAVHLNPWLNAIIGGRGTGKSTLVDFCRKTLRRDGELNETDGGEEGDLRSQFDNRMSLDGLLKDETVIEMVYAKDGQRFSLAWSQDGSAESISLLDGDRKIPEDSDIDIRERFPARLYSQKQLFALGRNPSPLLRVIDSAPEVQASESKRRIRQLEDWYISLCAAARSAGERASALPSREAELRDVQHKLDLIQRAGGSRALSDYRLRRQTDDAWGNILKTAEDALASERNRLDDIIAPELPSLGMDDEDAARAALERARGTLASVMDDLRQTMLKGVDEAAERIARIRDGADVAEWRAALDTSRAEYENALRDLQTVGVSDPSEYDDLLNQAARLRGEIESLANERSESETLEGQAADALRERRREIRELGRRRSEFAAKTSGESVRVQVSALADSENLPNAIGDILRIGAFERDRTAIADSVRPQDGVEWNWRNLDCAVSKMRRFISGEIETWDAQDRRFATNLKGVAPESVDRLSLYAPEDRVDVSFSDERQGGGWRSLAQGSPGQQTAALLAFVLGFGNEPVILDQPEDDLDSVLIYDLLVKRFKEKKRQRQVIVITHNPNIVVHGDAEMVASLDFHKGRTSIKSQGGLQQPEIRDEICRVMEGGREAFEARYRRIMPAGDSPA